MPRLLVLGGLTPTSNGLLAAARKRGTHADWLPADEAFRRARVGDTVLGLVDVRPALDGINPGLNALRGLDTAGVSVLNRAEALAASHDQLATARSLARARLRHRRTIEIVSRQMPLPFQPPFVLKPRFGSGGRESFLCGSEREFRTTMLHLSDRRWFRLGGVVAQELLSRSPDESIRIVVARGLVVGASRRRATTDGRPADESCCGVRQFEIPPVDACPFALAAARAVGADLVGVDLVAVGNGNGYTVSELDCCVDLTENFGPDIFDLTVLSLLSGTD